MREGDQLHCGGGPPGWEFFTHFDGSGKPSINGTADFFNDTQHWMNEKAAAAA